MIRSRFAPSPTGFMHIGNLRTALFEYLVAKGSGGTFILRIEDTDQSRLVDGSLDAIYNTLKLVGLVHDEGPDVGGAYGPYTQSERKDIYIKHAHDLVEEGKAYRCFCTKERLENLTEGYDRHCLNLSEAEILDNLKNNISYVIRQIIPSGTTTFKDEVYGEITVDNKELDDQVLLKSDGFATYNFANVVDDTLMKITHVLRGSEYLSSTPKYNLLYEAFGFEVPKYVHLPLIVNQNGEKLSKRKGDASFEDLIEMGFLPEAIINYIALLGWAPSDNREFFTLSELVEAFDIKGLSKSPSAFDIVKLTWMNSEYFKKMDNNTFFEKAKATLESSIKNDKIDLKAISNMVKSRINFIKDITELVDFIDNLPSYDTEIYINKKMKTDKETSLNSLTHALEMIKTIENWTEEELHDKISVLIGDLGLKNGQMLYPIRVALSGKASSFAGSIELLTLFGKDESIARIEKGIEKLK